jgi:hypothetical protein
VFVNGFNVALAVDTGASTPEVQTLTFAAVGAAENLTVTIDGKAVVTAFAGAEADTAVVASTVFAHLVNNADAGEGYEGYTFSIDGNVITVTAPGAEGDIADITAAYSVTNANDFVGAETVKGDANVVDIAGDVSTADNDNTITDGTGNDTIVLSTDTDSAEQVVLVADGQLDVIVNFAIGQDTIDLGAQWETALDSLDLVDNNVIDAADLADGGAAINDADGDVALLAIDTAANGNDTVAKIAALYTDDEAANNDETMLLGVVDGEQIHLYVITDGAAANDQVVTSYGAVDIM